MNLRKLLYSTLFCMAVISCGDDSGGIAGIDGTGGIVNAVSNGSIRSIGLITNKGKNSITVNGREFDTRGGFVNIDGNIESESDIATLAEGQVVAVQGAIEENVATARDIVINTQLRGPIENIDSRSQMVTVLEQTIVISSETIFADTATQFSDLRTTDVIQISGFRLTEGSLSASRVHRIARADTPYIISGKVEGLDESNTLFIVNGLTVDYRNILRLNLSNGLQVQVQGPPLNPRRQLEASAIRIIPDINNVIVNLELEGNVTDIGNLPRQFSIGEILVEITPETLWVGGDISQIQPNTKLEIEGGLWLGGILTAKVIIF